MTAAIPMGNLVTCVFRRVLGRLGSPLLGHSRIPTTYIHELSLTYPFRSDQAIDLRDIVGARQSSAQIDKHRGAIHRRTHLKASRRKVIGPLNSV